MRSSIHNAIDSLFGCCFLSIESLYVINRFEVPCSKHKNMDRRHTQQSVESEHAPLVSQELSNTGGQNERWEDFMQKRNHTASSEKLSNLCNACMRLLITTDRKPWKYSWIAIVTVLFLVSMDRSTNDVQNKSIISVLRFVSVNRCAHAVWRIQIY